MKKYSEFVSDLNESSGKNYVDVFDADKPYDKPLYKVNKAKKKEKTEEEIPDDIDNEFDKAPVSSSDTEGTAEEPTEEPTEEPEEEDSEYGDMMEELKHLVDRKNKGFLKSVMVFATPPTTGKNKLAYLADVLPPVERTRTPENRPEGEKPLDKNVFTDVEFEVIEVDLENNLIVGIPYSLRKRGITTPIDPSNVHEITFKRATSPERVPFSKDFRMQTTRAFTGSDKFIPSDIPDEEKIDWLKNKRKMQKIPRRSKK